MKLKPALTELAIITTIFMVEALPPLIFFGITFNHNTIDVNLHDTYFVLGFSWLIFILFLFPLSILLIYVIRSAMSSFKNRVQNFVLTASIFLFITGLLRIYAAVISFEKITSEITSSKWTIYPPLSRLHDVPQPVNQQPSHQYTHIILGILIFFMLLLVISAMLTGKNWNTQKYEQQNT